MRLKALYMKRYNNTQSNYIFLSPPHTYVRLEAALSSASSGTKWFDDTCDTDILDKCSSKLLEPLDIVQA